MTTTTTDRPKSRRRTAAPSVPEAVGLSATVGQEDLVRALRFVRTAADWRGSAVELSHDGRYLTLTVAGDAVEASTRVLCPGEAGHATVDGSALLAAVNAIGRRATVHLLSYGPDRLKVHGAGAWYYLLLSKALERVDVGHLTPRTVGRSTGEAFASVARVAYAASNDKYLPVLTAVRLIVTPGTLAAAATDRYRLARATAPMRDELRDSDEVWAAVVRAATVRALAARWRAERSVEWTHLGQDVDGRGWVRWQAGEETWTEVAVVPSEQYPKVDTLIPTEERGTWVDLDRAELLAGIAKASALTPTNDPITATLVVDPGESGGDELHLRLSASSAAADTTVDVPVLMAAWQGPGEAPNLKVAVNSGFVPDSVRALDATRVRMSLDYAAPSRKPVLFTQSPLRPESATDDLAATPEPDDTLVSLLMPVRMADDQA